MLLGWVLISQTYVPLFMPMFRTAWKIITRKLAVQEETGNDPMRCCYMMNASCANWNNFRPYDFLRWMILDKFTSRSPTISRCLREMAKDSILILTSAI